MIQKKIKQTFRPAVFVPVYYFDENKKPIYLLLKRKLHWKGWEFPKGKIEQGESKQHTAKREGQEESGHKILKLKKFNVSGKYFYHKPLKDRPQYKGQSYSLFSGEVKKGRVSLDPKEHSTYLWLPFNKAVKKLTWPNQKKCLKIVNDSIEK